MELITLFPTQTATPEDKYPEHSDGNVQPEYEEIGMTCFSMNGDSFSVAMNEQDFPFL